MKSHLIKENLTVYHICSSSHHRFAQVSKTMSLEEKMTQMCLFELWKLRKVKKESHKNFLSNYPTQRPAGISPSPGSSWRMFEPMCKRWA